MLFHIAILLVSARSCTLKTSKFYDYNATQLNLIAISGLPLLESFPHKQTKINRKKQKEVSIQK